MKILIIDRDPMFSSLLASKMKAAGHEVIESSIKNEGIGQIGTNRVDAVYFDPSPLSDAKSILLQIRRMVHNYPYLVMVTPDATRESGIKAGCNDGIAKPIDPEALTTSLANAARMIDLVKRMGDESYDFPSSGGVISKSAFNQLFLSATERVSRYSESSKVLFFSIPNYDDIKLDDGKYAADYAASKLAQTLSRLRRQSDILAQTGMGEYAILLQRAQGPTESQEAARRFAAALENDVDITSSGMTDVVLTIRLIDLPTGSCDFQHECRIKAQGTRNAG